MGRESGGEGSGARRGGKTCTVLSWTGRHSRWLGRWLRLAGGLLQMGCAQKLCLRVVSG